MLKKISGVLIGLIVVTTIPIFSCGQGEIKENAPVREKIKTTKVAQKPEKSPMDKALIGLWQAIEAVNKVAVVFKGDKSTYLIEPRGAITTTRPIFEWSPAHNADGYRLHLYDWQGNSWKIPTSAPKVTYPESGEELSPGTYTWRVEIFEGESEKCKSSSEPVRFKIISKEEKSQVEKELPSAKKLSASSYILTAGIYLKHLFFNEAISNFQKAIEIAPDNPYAYLGLAKSYTAIGKEANAEWEAAISHFNWQIKLAPTNPDLHAGLALAYEAVGKTEEALTEWEKAKGSNAYHLFR